MIGYPEDTNGWLFVRKNGKLETTNHARFDTRNYMEQAIALGQNDPVEQGFEETTGTLGLPLGGTDAEIRAQIKRYEDDIIDINIPGTGWTQTKHKRLRQKPNKNVETDSQTVEPPTEQNDLESNPEIENDEVYNDKNNDLKDTKSKQGTVKIMTDLEADGSILNARNLGYTLKWDQKHTKSGKSGDRYKVYKKFTTFEQIDTAINNKTMLRGDVNMLT